MLILSNTEYAIIINIIEYINTTSSPVVSFYAYVSFKDLQFDLRVRLSVKKTLGYSADTKLVPLRTLKKKKITVHIIYCWRRFSAKQGTEAEKPRAIMSAFRTARKYPTHLSAVMQRSSARRDTWHPHVCRCDSSFQHLPLIYTLIYGPKTYLLQDRFMIIIIIQVSKVWINEHLCNFAT